MLDKFLSRVNISSNDSKSITQKVEDYNKKVIEEKKVVPPVPNVDWDKVRLPEHYVDNKFSGFQNISKPLSAGFNNAQKRPSTYDVRPQKNYDNNFQQNNQRERSQQFQPREYIDDGSYFCSYAVGGNTLVCYKNKEKIEFLLEGISHPDKNNYLAKRANYFLNDLVKKQKVYIEPTENDTYNIFLDSEKTNCINTILINEGYHNSEPYNAHTKDKKTSFSKYKNNQESEKDIVTDTKTEEDIEQIKEKKNYAYGLFATNHNTFEALFNKEKITLIIPGIDNISKENQKICKSMIYDFVSKKSIVLKFLNEENNTRYVEVYNKEGDCLNQLIKDKKFPTLVEKSIETNKEEDNDEDTLNIVDSKENEQCSENDWDWVDSENNGLEVAVPEVTNLPAMFKKPITSKPDSPFKKKNSLPVIVNESSTSLEESFGEEIDVPEVTNLPAMFKKPVASKPDSPFKKKNSLPVQNIVNESSTNLEESFGQEINVPDVTNLASMFKTPVASKPDSPFKKKIIEVNLDNTQSISTDIDNTKEDNKILTKKKLSFIKR